MCVGGGGWGGGNCERTNKSHDSVHKPTSFEEHGEKEGKVGDAGKKTKWVDGRKEGQ